MLASLLINAANNQIFVSEGRFPPNLVQWAEKNERRISHPDYSHLINWIKKKKQIQTLASKEVSDNLNKLEIIFSKDLLEMDDEEVLIYILIASNI